MRVAAVVAFTWMGLGASTCAAGSSGPGARTAVGAGWQGGIGAVLRHSASRKTLVVDRVPEGTPAREAGLAPGDRIVAIDGTAVDTLDFAGVIEKLRGRVGTRVRLDLDRSGQRLDLTIERGPYR